MYFQIAVTGEFMENFFEQAKHDALPKGSKLINVNIDFEVGIPIIKYTFLNYRKDVLEEYAEKIKEKKSVFFMLAPNWSDKIEAEEILEPPVVTSPTEEQFKNAKEVRKTIETIKENKGVETTSDSEPEKEIIETEEE